MAPDAPTPAPRLRKPRWQQGYLSSTGSCFDIGNTTRSQLQRFERTGEPVDPHVDEESAANGSLMRLAPVPIRWHTDVAEAAAQSGQSSRATHAARRPVDTCRLLGAQVAGLIQGRSFDEVTDPGYWTFGPLHPAVEAIARGGCRVGATAAGRRPWRDREPPSIRGTGYCIDALEAALWAVAGATTFREAVLRAANLGDDADTTAAIAGQLAGARWGASEIPADWLAKLVLRPRIEELAAVLWLAATGEAPRTWSHDLYLHAWWVEPGAVLAGQYPGDRDRTRAGQKIGLLVDAGVRTFVDLTDEADGLRPYDGDLEIVATTRSLDLRRLSFPIPDFGVLDDAGYDEILKAIDNARPRGAVYVHCRGGIGRTGTVVGCLLSRGGGTFEEVFQRIAELRAGTSRSRYQAPEMPAQQEVIRRRTATANG